MRRDAIIKRMFKINQELKQLLQNNSYNEEEVQALYIEYLKLSVLISDRIPTFIQNDLKHKGHNCYFYAIDLVKIDGYEAPNNSIGSLCNNPLTKDNIKPETIIDGFKSDMDTLNIKVHPTSSSSKNSHDGYKVFIYIDESFIKDYHFVRENQNGIWSHKQGYLGDIEQIPKPDRILFTAYHSYQLIDVLEIDKPKLRSR